MQTTDKNLNIYKERQRVLAPHDHWIYCIIIRSTHPMLHPPAGSTIEMRYVAAWQHNKRLININVYVIPAYYGEYCADFYFDDDSGIYVRHSLFKNMITKES